MENITAQELFAKSIIEAKESLAEIKPFDIVELKCNRNPVNKVIICVEALFILLDNKTFENDSSWEELQIKFSDPAILQRMNEFKVEGATDKLIDFIKEKCFKQEEWDVKKFRNASNAIYFIGKWIELQVKAYDSLKSRS